MKDRLGIVMLAASLFAAALGRAQNYVYTPTNAAGAWVSTAIPDVLLWFSTNGAYNSGPITNLAAQVSNTTNGAGNWEPYIDVMGQSVFLIGANTFANDGTFSNQQFVLTLQPVAGGAPTNASEFYSDNGKPFTVQINLSRQNGNPQRVAGDHRAGATNFIAMAETSAGQLTPFQSNSRWTSNTAMYTDGNRYCTEQIYSLNPSTLVQKPLGNAWDFVYGSTVATTLPAGNGGQQLSRTGGRPVFLDNGNIAVVIDDKTCLSSASGEVTTFSIITPSGAIVKGPTLVAPSAIWDNVAAFSGGFAVRVGTYIAFYDNSGNLQASNDVDVASGLIFNSDRGDETRIASDIHSHYVYLAGATPGTAFAPVSLAVFDARTGQCVATNMVSDTDPAVHRIDRVNVAVNALNQFCVAYDLTPDPGTWTQNQIAVRVGRFDGTNITFGTPSFYPFVNSELDAGNVQGFATSNPSLAMTTNYVCVAGKGTVNSTNNPQNGPDTAPQTALYTVFALPQFVQAPVTPATIGITNVVPDVLLWFNTNGTYVAGPITNLAAQVPDTTNGAGNWEPYIDVMGQSVFLIGANTFANDGTFSNQQFVVTLQPAAGGAPTNASEFYSDNGKPFTTQINLSRQNGNPQRVAGDHRAGATNFVAMAETSAGQLTPFQSNSRWTSNTAMYTDGNRYCTEQFYSLNPSTLVQKPLENAWDFVYGSTIATTLPAGNGGQQLSRTGGKPVFLDNGNIAVVIDDKTCLSSTSGEVTTFSIITPAGAVVKGPTLVAPSAIWDNVAAFSGGFAVRVGTYIAFYDDSGNLTASNNVQTASGLAFNSDRGDETRIASDIHSHYVYLAGAAPATAYAPVSVAIFDARTGQCVATNTVSDVDPAFATIDRVAVAVDAQDHFCAVYDLNPNTLIWTKNQIAARVGKFDGTNITFAGPSFYPFINSENNTTNIAGFTTSNPNAAMTTSYICIAGKGTINSTNNPAGGPDTGAQTALYTVVNNPYATATPPVLSITPAPNNSVTVSWTGTGTLQSATSLANHTTWSSLTNTSGSTFKIAPGATFYRVLGQ
jgi:nitrite reductase/ring-hydroxylating ferredoxin subunit